MEAAENICCAKGEGTVDHSTVTIWFKKFHLDYKNLDQAGSDKSKTMDSEVMFQATEVKSESIR